MSVTAQDSTQPTSTDQSETALVLNYLQTHDALCPLCKYNLRGLTVPRCPECGREIKLTIGLTEPHLRALVALLVALCLSAGCGVASLGLLLSGENLRRTVAVYFVIYGSIASLLPAAVAIALHRRIMRLPPALQRTVAIFACAWDVALLLVFVGLMRRWVY